MNANHKILEAGKILDAGKSMGVYILICSLYKNMLFFFKVHSLIYTKTILLTGFKSFKLNISSF